MFPDLFNSLPPLECYVSLHLPINGSPKLADLVLDAISSMYHRQESGETQVATKEHVPFGVSSRAPRIL